MNLTRSELENVYKNIQGPEQVNYIKTGLSGLDIDIFPFLDKGSMITVAGRPAMGKTMFCLNLLERFCISGKRCLYFTPYLTKERIIKRLLILHSAANPRKKPFGKEELERMVEAIDDIEKWELNIIDHPECQLSYMEKLITKNQPDYIFIDSISELNYSPRGIKKLAEKYNVIFFITTGIKRTAEEREEHIPMANDVKNPKGLLDFSDEVLILYRSGYYGRLGKKDVMYVFAVKQIGTRTALHNFNTDTGRILHMSSDDYAKYCEECEEKDND
ncbi:MAG: hypothetical protein LUH11_03465 [Candidatus Gastranaerophilales bacterium]|nr:hypothetical protein [Candidatus Gastranaerophilales bacterium]